MEYLYLKKKHYQDWKTVSKKYLSASNVYNIIQICDPGPQNQS